MKVLVINGTEVRGVTHQIKETFLPGLRGDHEIQQVILPRDMPHFCRGCKVCFIKDEALCPHANCVQPIWDAMKAADLLVFATPVYALRAPGQVKALLDHLCCHWMVHRPDPVMFTKRAVVLTNSIGAPNGAAQRDIVTSLNWLGVGAVRCLGCGLMEGVIWEELSEKRRSRIRQKTASFAENTKTPRPIRRSLKIWIYFQLSKMMHKAVAHNENQPSRDTRYWLDMGWI